MVCSCAHVRIPVISFYSRLYTHPLVMFLVYHTAGLHDVTDFVTRACIQKFPDWVIRKYMLTAINTCWEATQRVMVEKLTRLTHKIVIQLHLVAESCTICSSRFRRLVRKLLDTPLYSYPYSTWNKCISTNKCGFQLNLTYDPYITVGWLQIMDWNEYETEPV
jgi:hypothetical protein